MVSFTWFDVLLVIVILASAVAGLRAGLARVVVGLVATIAAFVAGFWFYRVVAVKLSPWIHQVAAANILGFLIIFVGVTILGALIASLLSRLFRWIGLGWFNHFLGGVAGFVRGVLVIAVLVDIFVAFSPSPPPAIIQNSRVLPYVSQLSTWLVDLAPKELKDEFDQQMQNLRRFWATPSQGPGRAV